MSERQHGTAVRVSCEKSKHRWSNFLVRLIRILQSFSVLAARCLFAALLSADTSKYKMTTPVLYRWQPGWGLSSISPACIQVEVWYQYIHGSVGLIQLCNFMLDVQAYLRFAGLDFGVDDCNFSRTSPVGEASDFRCRACAIHMSGENLHLNPMPTSIDCS